MKFNSLKTKVLLWFLSIIFVIISLFSLLLYYFIEEAIKVNIETNLYHIASLLHKNLKNKNLDNLQNENEFKNIDALILENGNILTQIGNFNIKNYKKYLEHKNIFFVTEVDNFNIDAVYVLHFEIPFQGTIIISQKSIYNKAEDIEQILFFLNSILLLLLFYVARKMVDKILFPIKNISKIAQNIQIDNFSHKINTIYPETELKELVIAFNSMIDRLEDGVQKLDRFNSDVSHEIKTPLTVINAQIELTLKKQRNENYYQKSFEVIQIESKKIKKIIEDLLFLTKYSKQNILYNFDKSDFNTILIESIEKLTLNAKQKNIQIIIKKFDKVSKRSHNLLLESIFLNLLDNAIKYSLNNSSILISLYKQDEKIFFCIEDQGIGIAEEHIDKLTDRFYRVDKSRNKEIEGFGLGLSIVKNSLFLLDGNLKIISKEKEGTTVIVIL